MLDYWLIKGWRHITADAQVESRLKLLKGEKKALTFDEKIDGLYRLLGVLDSKASALMRFDGIILAVLTLLIGRRVTLDKVTPQDLLLLKLEFALVILSMIFCLLVVGMAWRFLSIACPDNAAKGKNSAEELKMLSAALHLRERAYQVS